MAAPSEPKKEPKGEPAKPEYDERNSGDRSQRFISKPEDFVWDDEELSSEAPTADVPTKPIEDA